MRLDDFIELTNPDFMHNMFTNEVCFTLSKFLLNCIEEKRPEVCIFAPPQHGKTELVIAFAAFCMLTDQKFRIAFVSYGFDLAAERLRQMKLYLSQYARYFKIPGRIIDTQSTLRLSTGANAYSIGIGGGLTGRSLDLLIIDDPYRSRDEARSSTINSRVLSWYRTVGRTRLSKKSGVLLIQTRWAKNDLGGYLEEKGAEIHKYPAINGQGKALVEHLHSLESLQEEKASLPQEEWAALYMQEPHIAGGDVFNSENIQYWQKIDFPFSKIFITADTAFKTGQSNDFSAFSTWGTHRRSKGIIDLFLLECAYGKWKVCDLTNIARECAKRAKKLGPYRGIWIEDKASGTGIIQALQKEDRQGTWNVHGIKRTTDKYARALACIPFISSGRLHLPFDIRPELLEEIEYFSSNDSHLHDDFVDTMMDAIHMIDGIAA